MEEDASIKDELDRLYNERSNLLQAYQEMAEAAQRLNIAFLDTIKAHELRLTYHRIPFLFYENAKKKCEVLLKDII